MSQEVIAAAEAKSAHRINAFTFLHRQGASFEQVRSLTAKISLVPDKQTDTWVSSAIYLSKTSINGIKGGTDDHGLTARFKTVDERGLKHDHFLHISNRRPTLKVPEDGIIVLDSGITNSTRYEGAIAYPKPKLIRYHIPDDIVPPGIEAGGKIVVKKGVLVDIPYEVQRDLGINLLSDTVFIVTQAEPATA